MVPALITTQPGVEPSLGAPATRVVLPGALGLPPLSGPHPVGRRLVRWVDRSRSEPVGAGGARQLLAWVWYPAHSTGREPAEAALPGPWGVRRADFTRRAFGDRAAQALASLRVNAVTGRPAVPEGRFPVLLFAPDVGWLPTDYSLLLEELASHGYVVVGLAAPSLACVVRLPSGREVTQAQAVPERLAVEDLLFARTQLAALDIDEDSPVRGRLDLEHVAALGHAHGGVASVAACAEAPGLRVGINLDGDLEGPALSGEAQQPLLYVTTESSPMADALHWWQLPLGWSERRRTRDWAQASRSARVAVRVQLAGTLHANFADVALLPSTCLLEDRREGHLGHIGGERGVRLTAELVRSFLAQHFAARPDAVPESPAWSAAEVTVSAATH